MNIYQYKEILFNQYFKQNVTNKKQFERCKLDFFYNENLSIFIHNSCRLVNLTGKGSAHPEPNYNHLTFL